MRIAPHLVTRQTNRSRFTSFLLTVDEDFSSPIGLVPRDCHVNPDIERNSSAILSRYRKAPLINVKTRNGWLEERTISGIGYLTSSDNLDQHDWLSVTLRKAINYRRFLNGWQGFWFVCKSKNKTRSEFAAIQIYSTDTLPVMCSCFGCVWNAFWMQFVLILLEWSSIIVNILLKGSRSCQTNVTSMVR